MLLERVIFISLGAPMDKKIVLTEKKEEKKKASELIEAFDIGKKVSIRRKTLDELRNINEMEEKINARSRLFELKAGKRVDEILGDFREMVDLSPPADPDIEVVELHPVTKPYSYTRVIYDNKNHEYRYEVLEPNLSFEEKKIFEFLKETLIKTMDVELTEFSEDEAKEYLRKNVDRMLRDYSISLSDVPKEKIMYYVVRAVSYTHLTLPTKA